MCCALYCIFTALKKSVHILFHRKCLAFDVMSNGGSFAHLVVYYLGGQEVWFLNLLYTKFCKRRSLTSKRIYIPGSLVCVVSVLVVSVL